MPYGSGVSDADIYNLAIIAGIAVVGSSYQKNHGLPEPDSSQCFIKVCKEFVDECTIYAVNIKNDGQLDIDVDAVLKDTTAKYKHHNCP